MIMCGIAGKLTKYTNADNKGNIEVSSDPTNKSIIHGAELFYHPNVLARDLRDGPRSILLRSGISTHRTIQSIRLCAEARSPDTLLNHKVDCFRLQSRFILYGGTGI